MYVSISRSGIPACINVERISDKSIACCLAAAFAAFAAATSSALRSKPNDLPPAPAAASPAAASPALLPTAPAAASPLYGRSFCPAGRSPAIFCPAGRSPAIGVYVGPSAQGRRPQGDPSSASFLRRAIISGGIPEAASELSIIGRSGLNPPVPALPVAVQL